MTVTAWGGPEMYYVLLCGLVGAGCVGSRCCLLVTYGHMCDGVLLGVDCLLPLMTFQVVCIVFYGFDCLGSSVGHVFDGLGSCDVGVICILNVCSFAGRANCWYLVVRVFI